MNSRLLRLRRVMAQQGLDSLFVSSEANVTYLSGFKGNESFLFLTPKKNYFLTDSRYLEEAQKETSGFTLLLREKKSYVALVEELRRAHRIKTVGFEFYSLPHALYSQLCQSLPLSSLVPTRSLVEGFRIQKDAGEISHTKRSVQITARGIRKLAESTTPGMSEKEVQAKLEYDTKLMGSQKPAFDIIIARGPKSSMPHAVSDHRSKIRRRDILLVDMGTVYEGYHSDLTRCFFMGKIPPFMRKIYGIVLEAQTRGIRKIRPGARAADVDEACRSYIRQKGYAKYFGHGTGHGVGLEIHEAPTLSPQSRDILKPGMIVTVEPGIYLPGRFGVRIEDMVLVTRRGCEVLTRDISKRI